MKGIWFWVLQEALPLTDQIDEAINYIKTQEAKLKKFKEKKESLTSRKRSFSKCTSSFESTSTSRAPKLEIREMGSSLQIILISGLDNQFLFCEIIRVLQDEGVEIATASFSVHGNSIFHTVHAQVINCIYIIIIIISIVISIWSFFSGFLFCRWENVISVLELPK